MDMHSPLETKFYKFRAYLMICWVFLSDEYEIDIYKSFSQKLAIGLEESWDILVFTEFSGDEHIFSMYIFQSESLLYVLSRLNFLRERIQKHGRDNRYLILMDVEYLDDITPQNLAECNDGRGLLETSSQYEVRRVTHPRSLQVLHRVKIRHEVGDDDYGFSKIEHWCIRCWKYHDIELFFGKFIWEMYLFRERSELSRGFYSAKSG